MKNFVFPIFQKNADLKTLKSVQISGQVITVFNYYFHGLLHNKKLDEKVENNIFLGGGSYMTQQRVKFQLLWVKFNLWPNCMNKHVI